MRTLDYFNFVTEAIRLLDVGYQGYLAIVVNTSVQEPRIEDIAILREFSDIFPKELPTPRKGDKVRD